MNRSLLFALALIGGLPLILCAQTSDLRDVPPPKPPLVAVPQPGTQWTVSVIFTGDASTSPAPSAGKRPSLIRYQCTQEITLVSVQWLDGTKTEGYVKGHHVIFQDPNTNACFAAPVQDEDPYSPLCVSGYPGIAWIAQGDYQGTEIVDKELCYRFFRGEPEANTWMPLPARTAWIRVRDKRPVRVKLGNALFVYSPIEEASSPVSIPQNIRTFLGQVERQTKALEMLKQMNQRR